MRPVIPMRRQAKTKGRQGHSRRKGAGRPAVTRSFFGRRVKFRNDPFSRFIRAASRFLSLSNPMFAVSVALLFLSGIAALFVGGYLHRLSAMAGQMVDIVATESGFGVSAIHLSGNRNAAPDTIYRALGFGVGQSIFGVDVEKARRNLRRLDWIADAEVTKVYPDAASIRLTEKVPFATWRNGKETYVVDRNGDPITQSLQSQFPHLPFFIGEQPHGASDLIETVALHHAVWARVKAMQRVDGRRWNLVLDDGVVIKLPETGWDKQLGILDHLIVEKGVLEFDIREIDLRTHGHYTFVLRHQEPPRRQKSRGDSA